MKKKNLIILLLIPFVISLLGIITINVSINTFYGDITYIEWDYDDVEAFKLSDKKYILKATAMNASNAPLSEGNTLIWSCENKDSTIEENIADVVFENQNYYLKTNTTGEVVVTCSNLKGNIFKKMTAVIYQDGVIIVTPEISSSQNNIDSNIYYGQYDLDNNEKVNAKINLNIKCIPSQLLQSIYVKDQTENLNVNLANKVVTINDFGPSSFTIGVNNNSGVQDTTYSFITVENGVNVYTYDDLLNCTNKSENGEIVVLRKSFESLETKEKSTSNNVELFGNYLENKFNFENEVYRFETTYNQEYIKQWNSFVDTNTIYSKVDNRIIAGLHIQKDFYGNGYTINMHNLTYPSESIEVKVDGVTYYVPELGENDLFKGPLPFYTLGDPNGLPLVTAYGQDNVGMYVEGNNIIINDLNLKNCDLKGSLSFLETVGTVLESKGDNITIKNSRLQNGKNILRCFSTNDFVIDNSLLSNSRNFLLEVGTNEYMSYDEVSKYTFKDSNGTTYNSNIKDYLYDKGSNGDLELNKYIEGDFEDSNALRQSLEGIQSALNNSSKVEGNYKGSLVIKDTYFYNSGIASIALSTLFNGPFLYSATPSVVTDLFGLLNSSNSNDRQIIPYTPTKVGGVSYPVKIDLVGKTRFYDYKNTSSIDITGLIKENISIIANQFINEFLGEEKEVNIDIDTIFPIKTLLLSKAKSQGNIYSSNGTEYINIPIAYYGGGLNLSTVNIDQLDNKNQFGKEIEIDFLDQYLTPSTTNNIMAMAKDIMLKCVTIVTGFEPFKFVCLNGDGYLFNQSPNVQDLIINAKGE